MLDHSQDDEGLYIIMELVRGSDLGAEMKLANVLAVAYQTARTGAAAVGIAQGVELML